MKSVIKITLLLVFIAASSCIPRTEDEIEIDEAYAEIGSTIEYKAGVCGQRPTYPLIIPALPSAYGVHLCALQILREECPFNDYPIFCLEMYTNVCDFCDVPLIGP